MQKLTVGFTAMAMGLLLFVLAAATTAVVAETECATTCEEAVASYRMVIILPIVGGGAFMAIGVWFLMNNKQPLTFSNEV